MPLELRQHSQAMDSRMFHLASRRSALRSTVYRSASFENDRGKWSLTIGVVTGQSEESFEVPSVQPVATQFPPWDWQVGAVQH